MIGAARKPETQVPAPHQQPRRRTATAPWSCCLRTQQCAKHYTGSYHPGEPFQDQPPQEGNRSVLGCRACAAGTLFVDIPPVSTRRRTSVCATGVLLTTPPHPHTRGKVIGSPLLTESLLFSLPAGTEMFHFPAFPPETLCVQALVTGFRMPAGFPHSDTPGSQLGCQLPGAYRRLQRPSSALGAKTSTDVPLVACHKKRQNRYKEMLASTIQFSKYGQEPNPENHHTAGNQQPQGNNTPSTNPPAVGESRPQPPTPTQPVSSDPEKPVHLRRRPGPNPQDPTARLGLSPSLLTFAQPNRRLSTRCPWSRSRR